MDHLDLTLLVLEWNYIKTRMDPEPLRVKAKAPENMVIR